MNSKRIQTLALGLTLVCASGIAQAVDSQGYGGGVASVRINETSSDAYGTERGNLVINEGGGVLRKYNIAGQACNGRTLSEQNMNILARMVGNAGIKLVPYYKGGGGNARCLVGFDMLDTRVYLY